MEAYEIFNGTVLSKKHVPHIEIDRGYKMGRDIIRVVVGHGVSHPNTIEQHEN
jgi:desulfoferrodoxin (superoxide reductase-like protein)